MNLVRSWHIEQMHSDEALLRIPFTLDDPVHPDYWRLDLTLPTDAKILGIAMGQDNLKLIPNILALGDPEALPVIRTFLVSAVLRSMNDSEPYMKSVRFVDCFHRRIGRLGGVGWKLFHVFEVISSEVPPLSVSIGLPLTARRTEIEEIFPSLKHRLKTKPTNKPRW